ncbi:MAG: DUF4145 domain-containing protein [Elusimicrobia bacterium]|nr:DUF4145 domain-containing protein [Elusimicrobiota bacterium]
MIIECQDCESKVDGKVLAEKKFDVEGELPYRYSFLECPVCHSVMVGVSELFQVTLEDYEWSIASRVWPNPHRDIDLSVPDIARRSLVNARKCFLAKVYDACAVMCGKTMEAICVEKSGERNLNQGLKLLLEKQVIDRRLYDWAEVLRKERNLGAHATEVETSKEDAKDLLDFATAMCEYIYVLTDKYKTFVERKTKKTNNISLAQQGNQAEAVTGGS